MFAELLTMGRKAKWPELEWAFFVKYVYKYSEESYAFILLLSIYLRRRRHMAGNNTTNLMK